jgi:hypothetical protein
VAASKREIGMETLRDILRRISDCDLAMYLEDCSLDSRTDEARLWLQAFEAESPNYLDWPAKLIGEHQIKIQDTETGRWIVLFV